MFNLFNKKKTRIKAVSDQSLIPYMKSLGLYERFQNGELRCSFCGDKVNLKNLQAFFPKEDDIYFVCSNIKCLTKLHKK